MSKYKVGDKVKIRKDLQGGMYYNNIDATYAMEDYQEHIVTICSVKNHRFHDGGYADIYNIEEDNGRWNWTDDMFENKHSDKCIDCDCCNTCTKAQCKYNY